MPFSPLDSGRVQGEGPQRHSGALIPSARGAARLRDLPLLTFTSIAWLRCDSQGSARHTSALHGLGGSQCAQAALKGQRICPTPWRTKYPHELFGTILPRGVSSSCVYSIMCLYQCEPVDIYLIVWGISQYCIVYSVARSVPTLALPIGSCVPLPRPRAPHPPISVGFVSTSLLSGTIRCSRLIWDIPCPSPSFGLFPKGPWFLLL